MRRWFFLAAVLLAPFPSAADPGAGADARVQIGPALRTLDLVLPGPLQDDLRHGRWDRAADALLAIDPGTLPGPRRARWAFVTAWALTRADRASDAVPLLGLLSGTDLPADDLALLRAEILRAAGDRIGALEAAEAVSEGAPRWGRAAVVRAEILRELGRTREAYEVYAALVDRPDPALGTPEALLALALRLGAGNPEAYPYLRRLWAAYPYSASLEEAAPLLEAFSGPAHRPTWQEVGARAERVMWAGDLVEAARLTSARAAEVTGTGFDACRFVYVHGRSLYRRNQLTNALVAFGDQGDRCEGDGAEHGARILYLEGTARFRKRQYREAAETFLRLAERYPTSTLADDGLLHGGIALQEAGDLDAARAAWLRGLDTFPDGDTVPEASFRVAFSYYLDGRPGLARDVAAALGDLPLASDPVHVLAGRYWHARWLAYPDVDAPTNLSDDAGAVAEAIAEWTALCEEHPHAFYAIEAYARLAELAPETAARLSVRPDTHRLPDLERPWVVRRAFFEDPAIASGASLMRLGLVREALADWKGYSGETLPAEQAWLTELRIAAGDWLLAHDATRRWMRTHPPSTLGEAAPEVLRIAYPDRYWEEVRAAAEGDGFPPRLFHALIREESNFNASIRSHAGARGLSQLMPATARETARLLGLSIDLDDLDDPRTNLTLGARYLDGLHRQFDGSPYLMLAGYNAGPGRVRQWVSAWDDPPTDEFVERIPFKETREYVKRVMGTWQVYRYQFDTDDPAFPDLSRFNHAAVP